MDLSRRILGGSVFGAAWRMAESALPVHRFPAAAERLWSGFAAAGSGGAIAILPRLSRMPRDRTAVSVALAGAGVTARVRTYWRDASAVARPHAADYE